MVDILDLGGILDIQQVPLAAGVLTRIAVPANARLYILSTGACTLLFGARQANTSLIVTPPVQALGTLTSVGVFTGGETVTIGTTVYTFRAALSSGPTIPYEVLIGANQTASHLNLASAINDSGVRGTDYSLGTVEHPTVWASSQTGTTTVVKAKRPGTAAAQNSIATTETGANVSWGGGTLASGAGSNGELDIAANTPYILHSPAPGAFTTRSNAVVDLSILGTGTNVLTVAILQ